MIDIARLVPGVQDNRLPPAIVLILPGDPSPHAGDPPPN